MAAATTRVPCECLRRTLVRPKCRLWAQSLRCGPFALSEIFPQFSEQSASVGLKEDFPEIWGNLPTPHAFDDAVLLPARRNH
eukprot:6040499-Prymnesium_polylepis.2